VRRVVADLLEARHCREHQAASFDPLGRLDFLHHLVDDGPVQTGLLPGEVAEDVNL
jgi:hypothetical protein